MHCSYRMIYYMKLLSVFSLNMYVCSNAMNQQELQKFDKETVAFFQKTQNDGLALLGKCNGIIQGQVMLGWKDSIEKAQTVHELSRVTERIKKELQAASFAPLLGKATRKSPHHKNQDRVTYDIQCAARKAWFVIADGHGDNGGIVADVVVGKCKIPEINQELARLHKAHPACDTPTALYNIIKFAHESLPSEISADSGSTVAGACINGDTLFFVNTGDSRALLFNKDGTIAHTTVDHKPEMERERIERAGGAVCVPIYEQTSTGIVRGIPRVFYVNQEGQLEGGLGVARSIGDTALTKAGVTWEPDITEMVINDNHYRLVVVSDGVCDVLSNKCIGKVVCKADDMNQAAATLVDKAKYRGSSDDCTAIVVNIPSIMAKFSKVP